MAYTTKATTRGGRNGRAILENGGLAPVMALPKDLGGRREVRNPEQRVTLTVL
jgi:organic hydroperoxide reductase OsmC/OhrA